MLNEPTLTAGSILRRGSLRAVIYDRLTRSLGKEPDTATPRDIYDALSLGIHEELSARWLATQRRVARARVKRLCYLSVEYLPGRSLVNALASLDSELIEEARAAVASMGHDFDSVVQLEVDPGLGNGGLGRLAACFLDSLATLQYPATGYGIRYDYGIFTQSIDTEGAQRESASTWLRLHNVWETPRSDARYIVRFGGRVLTTHDVDGAQRSRWVETQDILAVGFDQLVPGNRSPTVNHLRLWSGRALQPFHIEDFNAGNYPAAVEDQVEAKNLSRVLYPDDSTPQGKELRFKQQYFFVSASIQDILATHLGEERSLEELPGALAIQLNDTHPTLAIPELMRLLVDQYDMAWAAAWDICRQVFGYTNHTLLPEALETWPVQFFERFLPRHLEIIYRINEEFLLEVEKRFKGDGAAKTTLSIIAESYGRRVRMSHLAVVGSHKVNGVAKLHSELMQKTIFSGFARMYPDRFINVTNGITVRRWLKQSNVRLSRLLTERLGSAWENDLEEIERLRWAADDPAFRAQFRDIKRANKIALAEEVDRRTGIDVSVDSLFDVQVKRIHEYKRQLLNILYVVTRYQPHQGQARRALRSAHRDVRRQGRARLRDGQGHHPAHQQRVDHDQPGSAHAGEAQVRIPAGLRCIAGADDHAGGGSLRADLHGRHGGLGHGQHEAGAQWSADHRHAGRGEHRNPRLGGRGEHLHLRTHRGPGVGTARQRLPATRNRRRQSGARDDAGNDPRRRLFARRQRICAHDRGSPDLRWRAFPGAGRFRRVLRGAGPRR